MASVNRGSLANNKEFKPTTKFEGGSDEAAWLFPQQRVLPGQDRPESQGAIRRAPAASPSQGRTMRPQLSRDQPAGPGAGAGGRPGCGADAVARHHGMAGRDPSRTAAIAEGSA